MTKIFLAFIIANKNKVYFTDELHNNMDVFQFRIRKNIVKF